MIVTNYGANNIAILYNYSSNPSVRQDSYPIGPKCQPATVVLYDYNKDVRLDAFFYNFTNDNSIIFNGTQNGKFIRSTPYLTGDTTTPQYMCSGDQNNDNETDIVVVNR